MNLETMKQKYEGIRDDTQRSQMMRDTAQVILKVIDRDLPDVPHLVQVHELLLRMSEMALLKDKEDMAVLLGVALADFCLLYPEEDAAGRDEIIENARDFATRYDLPVGD